MQKVQEYMEKDKLRKDKAKEIFSLKEKLKTLKERERDIQEKSSAKETLESTLYYLNH